MKPDRRCGIRQVSATATVTLVVAGLSTVLPTAAAQDTETPGTDTCPALHVLLAPGTSETSAWSDPNADNHGYLSTLIKPVIDDANEGLTVNDPGAGFSAVLDEVTGGSSSMGTSSATEDGDTPKISRTTITYPSTAGGAFMPMPNLPKNFGDMSSYEQSVATGVAQMETVSEEIIDNCEDTQIAVLGYSQGAEVTSQFARTIGSGESDIPKDRIAGIGLFADPTREGGTPALVNGEDTPASPGDGLLGAVDQTMTNMSKIDTPAASGLSPEKTGIDHFGTLSDRTVSWCLPGDYVCGLPADSELATDIAGLVEQISLEDPIEAMQLLAESVNSAVKISDFEQVADISFGDDGFQTAGIVGSDDEMTSVLAERATAAATEFSSDDTATMPNPEGTGMSAPTDLTDDTDRADGTDGTASADSVDGVDGVENSGNAVESSMDAMPEVDDSERSDDSLPGTGNDQDATDAPSMSDAPESTELLESTVDQPDTSSTESSVADETSTQQDTATSSAPASEEPTESTKSVESGEPSLDAAEDAAPQPAEPAQPDPFSSPEAFANAAIPAAAGLGGMALGTGVTVVKDTLTPQNIGQIAMAGVSGGPEAAATVGAAKFAQSGMKLLEPATASGKAREALTVIDDAGFEVPEIMKIATELASWLSVTEHIEYGNRAMMPDGRTAEEATQDWLLAAAADASGDDTLTDDLLGEAIDFGVDALAEVDFDSQVADAATSALQEVAG